MKTENKKTGTKTTTQFTPEQIAEVLAALTPAQLAVAANERKQASLQPLLDEYTSTRTTLLDLEAQIKGINPSWNPPKAPSTADNILTWLKSQTGPVTRTQIANGIGKRYVDAPLKKLVSKGSLTFKDDKYTVTA